LARSFGPDIGVYGLSLVSNVLWLLGYPERGLKRSQEAVALADDLSHPYSQTLARGLAGWFHVFRRDATSAQEHAEASIRLASDHGFPYFTATGHILRGWALAEQGQVERGIAEIRRGAADYEATGAGIGEPNHLAILADVCGKAGNAEEGLALLAKSLEATQHNEERWCEAKLHLLQGELLRRQGAEESEARLGDAEACFQRAIGIARRQRAKSWELRAVIGLCRLWREQGEREKARRRLAEVYDWFTEGFDTPDLREARSLLEA
jgi:predicted ATPase